MDMRNFMDLQVEEINKHKWIASEKAGTDLTGQAEFDWISRHSAHFRKHIEEKHGEIEQK